MMADDSMKKEIQQFLNLITPGSRCSLGVRVVLMILALYNFNEINNIKIVIKKECPPYANHNLFYKLYRGIISNTFLNG